jgi:hypothetical protein
MSEIVSEKERIAFWDELSKSESGFLKGKKLLIMSSGKQDAVIGSEAGTRLQKLGAEVLVGGSGDWFMHNGANGEYAYMKALDDVDAVIIVSPVQSPDDNGMVRAMRAVASKPLKYGDTSNLLPGQAMEVAVSGSSKVAVINPRRNSPSMSFLSEVGGGKHEVGVNNAGLQLLTGLKAIMTR